MGRDPLTDFDYEFLTGRWEGPLGAAYNVCYEFCLENGYCTRDGQVTPAGRRAIAEYEMPN